MTDDIAADETPEERGARERREYKRAWIAKNPEKHRQHSRDSAARKKAAEDRRAREVERVRRWRDENPERVRETQKRWVEANKEKRREIDRRSYHRNKEKRRAATLERQAAIRADPEQAAKRKAWRDSNREHLNELQRQRRAANPEAMREYNRERRRISKRRDELGLPKVRKRRKTELERMTHANQAEEYFSRRMTKSRLRRIEKEGRSVTYDAALARQKAVEGVDDISNRVLGGYLVHRVAPELVTAEYNMINVPTFREELRMDLIARQARGGPAFDLDTELRRAAGRRVFERMTKELGVPVYVPPEARKGHTEKTRQMLAERISSSVADAKERRTETNIPRRSATVKRTPGTNR